MRTDPYYKPSGKFSAMFFLYYVLILALCSPILGTIYVYLLHYIPVIYFNFLLTMCCGFALGYLVSFAIKMGKLRNTLLASLSALIAPFIFKYIQLGISIPLVYTEIYGVWEITFLERFILLIPILLDPGFVVEVVREINEYGTWGLGSGDNVGAVNGAFLTIIWIVEFLIIAVSTVVISGNQTGNPFSEDSNRWYIERKDEVFMDVPDNFDELIVSMENGDFTEFIRLAATGKTNASTYLRLQFFQPPDHPTEEPYYMNIELNYFEKDKQKTDNLVTQIAIDAQNAEDLISQAKAAQVVILRNDSGDE